MTQLAVEQIAQLASNAGWTGPDLDTAVAVAMAESGGDPGSIGDTTLQNATWGPSVGLWQIRSINPGQGNAFEEATRNQQANLDPQTNANNAYAIQQHAGGHGWNEWSTYTNGAYKQYLPAAHQATQALQAGQTQTPTNNLQQQQPLQLAPQPAPAQPTTSPTQSSNSQGFLGDLEKLMESVSKLLNPADKLSKAGQNAQRAAASGEAFGKVSGSSKAHQAHVSNTQKYGQHASKSSDRVKTQSDDIKSTADDYQSFSNQDANSINQTAEPVREDQINPPLPSNVG